MKYLFLAISFFTLGYVIPAFAPIFQVIIAGLMLGFLALALYVYVDSMPYFRISDEQ